MTATTTVTTATQVTALRRLADLLATTSLPTLHLTIGDDVVIQVGAHLGEAAERTAMVTHLAALMGLAPAGYDPDSHLADWIGAQGNWAGHRIHVFTPAAHPPRSENPS
ncbi:hypothetical protein AB0F17_66360 [Nonomuraea sp. NPDC026600]|uniref:hypothetical protein n=1 Tax=Nonomuraea sp. NPDC026600 TaxID=3155363 RepID=UPI0033D5B8A0